MKSASSCPTGVSNREMIMRKIAFLAPLALTLAVVGGAHARIQAPEVHVVIGGDLIEEAEEIGMRDVDAQATRLQEKVSRALARTPGLEGARVELTLTDLKPNRPTMEQASRRPGLSVIDSRSIGGAAVEGELITADGQRLPVRLSRYSTSIQEVYGHTTWQDADRAFDLIARRISEGRLTAR